MFGASVGSSLGPTRSPRCCGRIGFRTRHPSTSIFRRCGLYREVVPPERLVHTERWGPEWPETVNTLSFSEKGGKTTITLAMLYPSKEARDAALKTGMKEGMDASYERLGEYLRTTE